MSTGIEVGAANAFLDARASGFPWIKFHVGDPGAAGTANPATETDRTQASFAAASGGAIATDEDLLLSGVAASEDYTHWTGWSASSGGTCGWSGTVTAAPVTSGNDFRIPSGGLTYTLNVVA